MVEIKQITAEEFLHNYTKDFKTHPMEGLFRIEGATLRLVTEYAIEFAKRHVEAALKAKIEAMEEHMNGGYSLDEIDSFTYNAYPLDKIL